MYLRSSIIFLVILVPLFLFPQEVVEIKYDENISLRTLAKTYFNNPNDWEILLRFNGYGSLAELKKGDIIKIPVKLYTLVIEQISAANEAISLANKEGAGILADETLREAVTFLEKAREEKKNGKLSEALEIANLSLNKAREAIRITKDKRIQAITAILSKKRGRVQTRRPEQVTWIDAEEKQNLKEKERVRTLSNSSGQIQFVDGSRLNLSENSLAVIEAMKQDVIKKTQTSSVTVIQGDVMAYLSSLSQRSVVNVTTPGVETNIQSRQFRTSRDKDKVSRFANYNGQMEVKAAGKAVLLKENEGSTIAPGKPPEPPKKLLPAPEIQLPSEDQTFFNKAITFRWNEVKGAVSYQFQISVNRSFSTVIKSVNLKNTEYEWKSGGSGIYYWRVSCIDDAGLAGPFTKPARFYVNYDVTPPFLVVRKPQDKEVIFQKNIVVEGTTEQGAILQINGKQIKTDQSGDFKYPLELNEGEQEITITSFDLAGNSSSLKRIVYCNLKEQLVILKTPNPLYVNSEKALIEGMVKPGTDIFIGDQQVTVNENGFTHILTLQEGSHLINIIARTRNGVEQTTPLTIYIDLSPPEISLINYTSFTNSKEFTLSGSLSEEAQVKINDVPVNLISNRFEQTFSLSDGMNVFNISAEDRAGNREKKTVVITRDTYPPEISDVSLSSETVSGGDILKVRVAAMDKGIGLARTGSFVVTVPSSNSDFSGILTYSGAENSFEGSIFIPPGVKGTVRVKKLKIKDRLGNMTTYPD